MRKFNLRLIALFLTMNGLLGFTAFAQNARVQLIHNAAAVDLDTVDIYINGTLWNDAMFRTASPLMTMPRGTYRVSVNHMSSIDSSDQVLFSQNVRFDSLTVLMVTGVDVPANYAANPNGLATGVRYVIKRNFVLSTSLVNTSFSIMHGVTDAARLEVIARPNSLIKDSIGFGDTSATITLAANNQWFIDLRTPRTPTVFKSYLMPLGASAQKSFVLFTSGFVAPAANMNGEDFGLFMVDTAGMVTELTEGARMQIVNNSPDATNDTIKVWMHNLVTNAETIANVAFTRASGMLSLPAGMYDITVTKENSADTSAANVLAKWSGVAIQGGSTYLGVATGVITPANYTANPDALSTAFTFVIANYSEYAGNTVRLYPAAGVTDANALHINQVKPTGQKWAMNISYGTIGGMISAGATDIVLNFTNADSSKIYGAYRTNLSGQGGKSGVIITTGFLDSTGNPSGVKLFQPYIVFSDGSIQMLRKLTADVQLIHNSADVTNDSVDIYVNGVKLKDDFGFRMVTPFMSMNAYVPYTIAVAPKTSTDATTAFYTTTLTLDSTDNYYLIANGVKNVAQYRANPNGQNIAFKIQSYKGARKVSQMNNVDLLYYHGATDVPATSIRASGQVQYLSKNDVYGAFHGYAIHQAQNELIFEVRQNSNDSLLKTFYGDLGEYKGKAGLVFGSGFLHNDASNQNGAYYLLFVAWPDGSIDTIDNRLHVGLKEQAKNTGGAGNVICYPNPANEQLHIALDSKANTTAVIGITDITGKSVLAETAVITEGVNEISLNTAALPAGLYLLNVSAGERKVMQKIMISR